jgi:hypothetical protein
MSYKDLSLEQLEAKAAELQAQQTALIAERRAVAEALDYKRAEAKIVAELADMSPAQREAYKKALAA